MSLKKKVYSEKDKSSALEPEFCELIFFHQGAGDQKKLASESSI